MRTVRIGECGHRVAYTGNKPNNCLSCHKATRRKTPILIRWHKRGNRPMYMTIRGIRKPLTDWAKEFGIQRQTLYKYWIRVGEENTAKRFIDKIPSAKHPWAVIKFTNSER